MKHILILDDDLCDIQIIRQYLSTSKYAEEFSIIHGTTLHEYERVSRLTPIDLLLLDLEFTNLNTTSLSYLQIFPRELPIIVISNHQHYQHTINSMVRIAGFISKKSMATSLVPMIEKTLGYSSPVTLETFSFPPSRKGSSFKISTCQIRYIQKTGRTHYTIYTTSGKSITIDSSYWMNVLSAIIDQHISSLKPVSQGHIINTNCISSIRKNRSGSFEIQLINLPNVVFTISSRYENLFQAFIQ